MKKKFRKVHIKYIQNGSVLNLDLYINRIQTWKRRQVLKEAGIRFQRCMATWDFEWTEKMKRVRADRKTLELFSGKEKKRENWKKEVGSNEKSRKSFIKVCRGWNSRRLPNGSTLALFRLQCAVIPKLPLFSLENVFFFDFIGAVSRETSLPNHWRVL